MPGHEGAYILIGRAEPKGKKGKARAHTNALGLSLGELALSKSPGGI